MAIDPDQDLEDDDVIDPEDEVSPQIRRRRRARRRRQRLGARWLLRKAGALLWILGGLLGGRGRR